MTEHFDAYAVAKAFNEWMRRYTESPEQFEREWETVGEYLKQQDDGVEPDYGKSCAAYLLKLIDVAVT
ncbi:hypothetical protein [Paenochrobactrum pullorum]|uniref:hypothetical protein n=1 Tax=Paenochrobactrum pullorum TaxID=1324351 RepID=UPI0035BC74C9